MDSAAAAIDFEIEKVSGNRGRTLYRVCGDVTVAMKIGGGWFEQYVKTKSEAAFLRARMIRVEAEAQAYVLEAERAAAADAAQRKAKREQERAAARGMQGELFA